MAEVERVQASAQLVAHDEVGQRLVLGGEALVAGAVRACNSKCVKMILLWVWLSLLDAVWVGVGEFVE
ncbi:hypothetical protein AB0K34_36390, partial [Actinomadura sp. NPDC049382]|uniref:hypothetical protein n=1 Tax=Actinomadura sp. NPDC049382 TaxID=3158220 RepID=UPI0034376AE5